MAATEANFTDTQGDTVRIVFPINDSAGSAYDFTGSTVRAQVREENPDDDSPLVATFTIESATSGEVTAALLPGVTSGLVGVFAYDLEVEDASGDVDTTHYGTLTFLQQVTV